MAILAFQKPDKVLMLESNNTFGKFEFRPLEPGYGVTIGNALRRILLSSLEGYAICNIRIDGVQHEFATIPGVKEDVTNVILNLKQVRATLTRPLVSKSSFPLTKDVDMFRPMRISRPTIRLMSLLSTQSTHPLSM